MSPLSEEGSLTDGIYPHYALIIIRQIFFLQSQSKIVSHYDKLHSFVIPFFDEPCNTSDPPGQILVNSKRCFGGLTMNQEVKDILNQQRKLMVLEFAKAIGSATKACQEFSIPRSSFYDWKKAYDQEGKAGLLRKKPVAKSHPRKLKQSVVEKIIYLRNSKEMVYKRP